MKGRKVYYIESVVNLLSLASGDRQGGGETRKAEEGKQIHKLLEIMEEMGDGDNGARTQAQGTDVVEFGGSEEPQVVSGRRAKALKDKRKKWKPGSFGWDLHQF